MLLPGNGHSRFPGTNLLLSPIYKRHAQIVGDAGSGKSVLTKQIFAALAQNQVEVLGSVGKLGEPTGGPSPTNHGTYNT